MASMERVLELNFRSTDEDSYFQESHDWLQHHVFQEPRHTEKIEGTEIPPQGWRMKERMKTVSVALVLALNIGVDPPGLIKLQPCARLECWIDPVGLSPQKALEQIGQTLQKQYERWQPRARYKQSLDPTVDEVKKLCVSLRRNAKEERVLFHYNGHGVPCPTTNGEIWVFNRNYTQYIPLSIYDLQTWMGYPSIYVYDCNNAGIILKSFHQFAEQHEKEYFTELKSGGGGGGGDRSAAASSCSVSGRSSTTATATPTTDNCNINNTTTPTAATTSSTNNTATSSYALPQRDGGGTPPPPNYLSGCIQLGACSDTQVLPMNPDLPADLFTACLTTPIKMALRWFVLQNQHQQQTTTAAAAATAAGGTGLNKLLCDGITLETVEKVPGQLNDRRTMLGELNWIFTAITDTIAWNTLPRALFQKLFRQDLLVASLFRNFLLAERIMRSYDCTPVSSPKLPPTSHHPMWQAWDYALDQCLSQLKTSSSTLSGQQPSPTSSATNNNNAINSESSSNSSPTTGGAGASAAGTTDTATASANSANTGSSSSPSGGVGGGGDQFSHTPSPFFEDQLTAFEVWLKLGNTKGKFRGPQELPVVLQVLLSQVHRVRALELLGKFLDLGWWAVNLALSVGIFPYVLKLLQSSAKELRPLLVFIWAKILAVDQTCQADLVRDGSHKYFIQMVTDTSLSYETRQMAVFVLSNIVRGYPQGQQAALQSNSIATCLLALEDTETSGVVAVAITAPTGTNSNADMALCASSSSAMPSSISNLHKWVCICLGLTWQDFPSARWCGVRDSAHEKIADILHDDNAEVRAAAVFALGSYINGIDRTEHSNSIDHAVVNMVLNKLGENECSSMVRQEIVVALHNFALVFENQFVAVAERQLAQETQYLMTQQQQGVGGSLMSPANMRRITSSNRMRALANVTGNPNLTITGAEAAGYYGMYHGGGGGGGAAHVVAGGVGGGGGGTADSIRRVASSSSLSNLMNVFIPPAAVGLPSPVTTTPTNAAHQQTSSPSTPSSSSAASSIGGIYTRVYTQLMAYERDPNPGVSILARTVLNHFRTKAVAKQHQQQQSSKSFRDLESSGDSVRTGGGGGASTPTRISHGGGGDSASLSRSSQGNNSTSTTPSSITPIIATKFINWCWSQFSKPSVNESLLDPQDPVVSTRSWVYSRNAKVRRDCFKRVKNFPGKIEEQAVAKALQDVIRIGGMSSVRFHPYENLIVVGGPGVVESGSSSGGGGSSASSSLSSLDVNRIGAGGGGSGGSHVCDKSAFLIFEYDDTSYLSAHMPFSAHHHHYHHNSSSSSTPLSSSSGSSSSSQPQTPSSPSFQMQPKLLNRNEIEHFATNSFASSSSPVLTSLEWLNPHDSIVTNTSSLLATGCNDGCVRVYKPQLEAKTATLVTAWSVSSTARVNNLLLKYEPESTRLVVSYHGSRSSHLCVWDVASERMVREIGGSSESGGGGSISTKLSALQGGSSGGNSSGEGFTGPITSIDCHRSEPNTFVLGGEDGSVHLVDLRVRPSSICALNCREYNAVHCVRLRHDRTVGVGFTSGRVKFFDLRTKSPSKTIEATVEVTAADIHPNLPYFAIGTASSTVNVYGFHGQSAFLSNSIREGFGGFGRIGFATNSATTSLAFHEFKPFVAFVDSYSHFSVYKAKK